MASCINDSWHSSKSWGVFLLSQLRNSAQVRVSLIMPSLGKNGRRWYTVFVSITNPCAKLPLRMAYPIRQSGVFFVVVARKEPDKPLIPPCLSLKALERDELNHNITLLTTCLCVLPLHEARHDLQPAIAGEHTVSMRRYGVWFMLRVCYRQTKAWLSA